MIRVFPRRTKASPDDDLAFFGCPPDILPKFKEIHISVLFTYDLERAKLLCDLWSKRGKVIIGGPALGTSALEFRPGMYVKRGYVITSRGCPNKCWFCSVWRHEGNIRELKIKEGSNILDSNLLACSPEHIKAVFEMLKRQPQRPQFTGGLEAARLKPWHVKLLKESKTEQMFFAYDTDDDYEPLINAGKLLSLANFTRSHLRCYVLVGYPGDTFPNAEKRLLQAWEAGFLPMAMLWRGKDETINRDWQKFQRIFARPAITKRIIFEKLFL